MIRNTIESHIKLPDYSGPIFWRNQFHTEGLNAQNASAHLINSPWVTLNQQYCAEYLQAFVREVELRERFVCLYPARPGITRVTDIKDSLQLITSRYDIAGLYTDIDTLSRMLLSRIKGICLSYHYENTFFQRGFGKTDRRVFPHKDFLTRPLEALRRYHNDYNIPSNKLSIYISYGDPSWTILTCLEKLDKGFPHRVVSLDAVQAKIYVDHHDASVSAIDRELEVLRAGVARIIEKMHVKFPSGGGDILELEALTKYDMKSLRI
jgi:hypothetical protein